MINEHAQKIRVKDGYYTHSRPVGVSAQSCRVGVLRYEFVSLLAGVYGSRRQALTTAGRHHAVRLRNDIDRDDHAPRTVSRPGVRT